MIVRHIDTARMYRNEQAVGEAVRESGVPRGQIFISTRSHLCMLCMTTALGLTSCAYTQRRRSIAESTAAMSHLRLLRIQFKRLG